jgi:hypothetical protein
MKLNKVGFFGEVVGWEEGKFKVRYVTALCNIIAASLFFSGCVSLPYQPSAARPASSEQSAPLPPPLIRPGEPQIERGEPYVLIDGIGHLFFSLPEKLILWNWKMGNHDISPETEKAIKDYLTLNNLSDVKVRLNDYAPLDEWRRLFNNESIGPWWRYTIGALMNVAYTILPGRILGGDHYNTFTNTIHIYSDLPVVGLHEAGHSKDYEHREYKALSAIARLLPLVPLFQEEFASSEAISYAAEYQMPHTLRSCYKIHYPAWGTYAGGEASRFLPGGSLINAAFAIPGHIIGRIKASKVEAPACSNVAYEVNSFDPLLARPVVPLAITANDNPGTSTGTPSSESRSSDIR